MVDKQTKIRRAKKLISLLNWGLNNFPRVDDTARKIRQIAENPPRSSVGETNRLCARIAYGELAPSKIHEEIECLKKESSRATARAVVPVFMEALAKRSEGGIPELAGRSILLPIGRAKDGSMLAFPLRPDFYIERHAKIVPVFQISWTEIRLTEFQKALISSIIKIEFLSQTDFQESDAEVWCFPRMKRSLRRDFVYWGVRSYSRMTVDQIQEQFERYTRAVSLVVDFFERQSE